MSLKTYRSKRVLKKSKEPTGKKRPSPRDPLTFVIQKHAASHLHYDLRLELDGVLLSWAVPKEPTMDPAIKRLAIHVEDHPFEYGSFEGDIPPGNYGAGHVDIWDKGFYESDVGAGLSKLEQEKILRKELKKGELKFTLHGKRLHGSFALIRLKKDTTGKQWLLIKHKEQTATPHHISPMLAFLTDKPFDSKDWIFEIKWDGFRAIAEIKNSHVALYSRNFLSFNEKFPTIVKTLSTLKGDAVLDGEIVVLDKKGVSHFQLLQNYLKEGGLRYAVFDILFYQGKDLRNLPLIERKEILKGVIKKIDSPFILYSDYIKEKGVAFFKKAKSMELEGIMAKEAQSHYVSQRSRSWLKIKTHKRQEFVIGGFTQPKGSRKNLGALILGVYKKGTLTYAGHVGGGFNTQSLAEVYKKLIPLIIEKSPFKITPKTNTPVTWVKPKYTCEVSFQELTKEGIVRQPIFHGLREDKPAKEVDVEEGITHADKVLWPAEGYTKKDLLNYYEAVAPYILPYLKDRPIMMHRFPNGVESEGFFQKEAPKFIPKWVKTATVQHTGKKITYILIQDLKSLLYVANLACIEIHAFLSRIKSLNHPDFLCIDLDRQQASFEDVIEIARETHRFLDHSKVEHYCKTSGKKGLHIYIPLQKKYSFQQSAALAKQLAASLHEMMPDATSLIRDPKKRRKEVYLDYLQNDRTKTVIAPYSVRVTPQATVSTPLEWKEVKKGLDPLDFTITTVPKRLIKKGDLWKGIY